MGVEKWKRQSYEKLKKQCTALGKLWDDPLFPSNDSSLALSRSGYSNVVWKRPSVSVNVGGSDVGNLKTNCFKNVEGIVP